MKTAILLVGHGSRAAGADNPLQVVAEQVKAATGVPTVEVSFSFHQVPSIQDGIASCVAQGARRILLVPYFLTAGTHVLVDLPADMELAAMRHPGLELALGKPLGAHRKLAEIVCERIEETLQETGWSQ